MATTAENLEIDRFLDEIVKNNATDVHLSVANPPYFRIDGQLTPLESKKIIAADYLEDLASYLLSEEQKKELEAEREITFGYTAKSGSRFKINIFYQSSQLSITIKVISSQLKSQSELGLSKAALDLFDVDKGLILVAGPLDSGKSTTISAIIQHINETRTNHVVTLENPIEYVFSDNTSIVDQREIGKDTNSCSQALDSILKEDINVVAIPDLVEAGIVSRLLDIAESNRLVIAGINSERASQAISKIVGMFPKNIQPQIQRQLADTLAGVIVQVLVPGIGGGQVLIEELLLPSQSVRSVIKEGDLGQLDTIIQTSRQEGMISFDQSLANLIQEGKISSEVAVKLASDKESIKLE